MVYEKLQREAAQQGVDTYEKPLRLATKGLYYNNVVWINSVTPTNIEKGCILAEELGHHHTSSGNILDQTKVSNCKQEKRARQWAYYKLVPLSAIVQAHKAGIRNQNELADRLSVTEDFLNLALKRYQEKYGLFVKVGIYTICFEPLGVLEMFEF